MTRKRREGGHYQQTYSDQTFLDAFREAAIPVLTSLEVAEAVGCTRETARVRLNELAEDGELYRKEVGSRAVVYVLLPDSRITGYGEWKQSLWTDE